MNMNALFDELGFMQKQIATVPEKVEMRWTTIESCYQFALTVISSFLRHAVPPMSHDALKLRDTLEHHALMDIVRNSSLHQILDIDADLGVMKYRQEVSESTKEVIAEFVWRTLAALNSGPERPAPPPSGP